MKKILLTGLLVFVIVATWGQTRPDQSSPIYNSELTTSNEVYTIKNGTVRRVVLSSLDSLLATGSVSEITYVSDTSGISSPGVGDLAINTSKDTLVIRGDSAWIVFSGGGGSSWNISDGSNNETASGTIIFSGSGIVATSYDTGSNTMTITGTEVDGSTTNEIQTLSFTSPNLSISSGNSVDLSSLSGAVTVSDTLYANQDTLFHRNINNNIDTIIVSVSTPADTAYAIAGRIVIPWEGDTANADTVNIDSGRPVDEQSSSSDTITVSYASSNIVELTPGASTAHIKFSGLSDGTEYTLRVRANPSSSITLPQSFFIFDTDSDTCNTRIVTSNLSVSFYNNGTNSFATSYLPDTLQCYSSSSNSAEYDAIITHAQGQGHTLPSSSVQNAGAKFIDSLIASTVWDSLDQLLVLVTDGDSDFSLINWKDPGTNNGDTIGAPVFTSLGGWNATGGTSDVINLQYNPADDATNWALTQSSVGVYLTGTLDNNSFVFGTNDAPTTRLEDIGTSGAKWNWNGQSGTNISTAATTGLMQFSLENGNFHMYDDGTLSETETGTPTGLSDTDFYLMGLRLNAAGDVFDATDSTLKYYLYYSGGDLSSFADEIQSYFATYLTDIGL